ncbi:MULTISPECIES: hypothetical protein [unclassified Streptomyces]|uniref:hypothetical protein n=1 Tax=unclassified Streptomyces TaxID=2593676 RepID=UPI003722F642
MTVLAALVLLLLAVIGGCVCVFWAARGGPRWVRGVAMVTLLAGAVAPGLLKGGKRSGQDTTVLGDGGS